MGKRNAPLSETEPDQPDDLSVAIIRARFNRKITGALRDGAVERLYSAGIPTDQIHTFDVPGSFELPQAAQRLDERMPAPDGLIAIGAVIQGETPHFDYICRATTDGLQEVALQKPYPVIFGVLTCDTREQAKTRAGLTDADRHKGVASARALLEMIQHRRNVEQVASGME